MTDDNAGHLVAIVPSRMSMVVPSAQYERT